MPLMTSNILICIVSLLVSSFFLWQGDKAIFFHISALRSMRTRQNLNDLLDSTKNHTLVFTKVIPAIVVLTGVGMMTISTRSVVGLIIFVVGVIGFCTSSAFYAYAALSGLRNR